MLQVKCRHRNVFFVFILILFPSLKKQRFLSLTDEPVLDEERSLSVHLQPPGKMPHASLKVIQTVHSHLPKAWNVCLQLSYLPHSMSVKLLSFVSLQLFLKSFSGTCPAMQLHGRGQRSHSRIPSFKLSSLACAHTLRRHSSSPSHLREEATMNRMLRCGEPAANGKRRRE